MTRDRFALNERQLQRFQRFVEYCESWRQVYQEEAAPMSPFLWTFRPGSIGDDVVVWCGEVAPNCPYVDLSLDDDGQFLKPATEGRIWGKSSYSKENHLGAVRD